MSLVSLLRGNRNKLNDEPVIESKPRIKKTYKCVLIDPIDTLISIDDFVNNILMDELSNINIRYDNNFIHNSIYLGLHNFVCKYKKMTSDNDNYKLFISRFTDDLINDKYLTLINTYTDVIDTLSYLNELGVETVSVTTLPSKFIRYSYQKFGYNKFFDTVLSDNKFLDSQSRINNVVQFKRLFDYETSEILVVGNSNYMYDIANRLNCDLFCLSQLDRCDASYDYIGKAKNLSNLKNMW